MCATTSTRRPPAASSSARTRAGDDASSSTISGAPITQDPCAGERRRTPLAPGRERHLPRPCPARGVGTCGWRKGGRECGRRSRSGAPHLRGHPRPRAPAPRRPASSGIATSRDAVVDRGADRLRGREDDEFVEDDLAFGEGARSCRGRRRRHARALRRRGAPARAPCAGRACSAATPNAMLVSSTRPSGTMPTTPATVPRSASSRSGGSRSGARTAGRRSGSGST